MSVSSAEKRLSQLFEESARKESARKLADDYANTLTGGLLLDADDTTPNNPTVLAVMRKIALTVSDADTDKLIKTAFRKARLDERNPFHWRILMWMFARAHFGAKPVRGARKIWTADKYCELLYDIAQVRSRNRHLSDTDACRAVLKHKSYGRGKKPLTVGRLRKALAAARNPKHNTFIATQLADKLLQQQTRYAQAGKEWTSQTARQHERELTESIIEWIGSNWREYSAKRTKGI